MTYQGYVDNVSLTPWNCSYMSGADAMGVESLTSELNDTIATAVTNFDDSRFVYVDPNYVPIPPKPTDNELCSTQSHFNGASSPAVYSFHPNTLGHADYATIIADAIS